MIYEDIQFMKIYDTVLGMGMVISDVLHVWQMFITDIFLGHCLGDNMK